MANKFFAFILVAVLAFVVWIAIGAPGSVQMKANKAAEKQGLLAASPEVVHTATLEPTPTVGYQATAIAAESVASTAQAEADAANRQMVQATAQHEANLQEQAGWTAEASRQQLMFLEWTATAQPTSFRSTQTQVVQEQTKQAVIVTQLAMTLQAPTTIVMLAEARSQADFAPAYNLASVVGLFSLSVFMLVLTLWLLRLMMKPAAAAPVEEEPHFGTVVSIKTEAAGYTSLKRMVIPCPPVLLQELAEGLMWNGKSLAINQWEGKATMWTRQSFLPMRNFLLANQLARSTGSGNLVLTAEGESFLHAWLEKGDVPHPYTFDPIQPRPPEFIAHMSENHDPNQPVGEGRQPDGWVGLDGIWHSLARAED